MTNDTLKLIMRSRRPVFDKSGDMAPAENQATDTLPKISDIREYCFVVNRFISSSIPQPFFSVPRSVSALLIAPG